MSAHSSASRRRVAANAGPEYDTHPELALAAVLQLLSRFPARRSPALAQAIAGWDVGASQGALFDDGRQLSRLIGRPTTPLAATVAAALAQR